MSPLASALSWYHKKIGAYDKQSWEKTVDQRILRGVCAIPKKSARIKTELIDVDLVRGSAFPKAKPQHSWIATTLSGIKRVLVLPCFFNWWRLQTSALVSSILVFLYVLQIIAMWLYFSSEEKEFPDVPVSEILTPTVMMFILGIVHSQIVATFSTKKSQKSVTRARRRRTKLKRMKRIIDYESKSSPETASDDKMDSVNHSHPSPTTNESCDEQCAKCCNANCCSQCEDKKYCKAESHHLRFTFENEERANKNSSNESGLDDLNYPEENKNTNCHSCVQNIDVNNPQAPSPCEAELSRATKSNHVGCKSKKSFLLDPEEINLSSGDDYFVAKKHCYSNDQWKNYVMEIKSKRSSKKQYFRKANLYAHRRYSDVGPSCGSKELKISFQRYQKHRYSEDNILSYSENNVSSSQLPFVDNSCSKECERSSQRTLPASIKLPINIKTFSSSGESGADTTSPNTPSKPQTSDMDWPLMTNTDCNSDSSDCYSQCSQGNGTDISPSENPFAWEMQEPSVKFMNVSYTGSDKGYRPRSVSCTIWENNECKKADLTVLDISSAIIRKVDSSHHSMEYLYVGLCFALILCFLPLLFRIQNASGMDAIQDVTTDVLTLTVPTSDEVLKVKDVLLEVALGSKWRVKIVVIIVIFERFTLSFAYFFLLSVAEKTFKQRFLYAKHFCHLTSSRRARRSDLPHFRLNKVRNIKTWLSIRSYLKKLGPQRSVDVIVSIAFILEVCVVSLLCIQLLKETNQFADKVYCWELLYWTLALGIYLLRFMVIGTKINKKYRNLSVLITEQINLYLHMEQKPHKKEELMLANSVLKLAADLLKELESPFKISGLCANSYLYNITKVIVLSAFSAVLTDILGFKLKLYKIRL